VLRIFVPFGVRKLLRKWRWDVSFFLHYLYCRAMLRRRAMRALEKAVRDAFKHPRLSRVEVRLYPSYGRKVGEEWRIFWGAPITVTVWFDGVPVVGMALDVHTPSRLRVWQLQGSRQTKDAPPLPRLPDEIRPWQMLFVEAIMMFAQQQGFKEVFLRRAEQLSVYRWPGTDFNHLEGAEKKKAIRALRGRLKHIHNTTARRLGFTMGDYWWVWRNAPDHNN
jgi:hypothetical protein